MNWGEIPQEFVEASAQLRHAQKSLEKTVRAEINRQVHLHCQLWRMKVARVLREREMLRSELESAEGLSDCPKELKLALEIIRQNDIEWFPKTTPKEYIDDLENPYLGLR